MRGQAENHIKAWRRHLAADRTLCSRATANQLRLMLHLPSACPDKVVLRLALERMPRLTC